jgi:hypothetical protein
MALCFLNTTLDFLHKLHLLQEIYYQIGECARLLLNLIAVALEPRLYFSYNI